MTEQLQVDVNRIPISDIGRWWIATQRANEDQRNGFGADELRKTLEHLRRRGDSGARYHVEGGGGWVHVTLGEIPIGGASA